jgi:hypothetical protein
MFAPAQAALTCHIHPPQVATTDGLQQPAEAPLIVGPFSTIAACEQGNAVLFSGQGRCHCSFDSKGKDAGLPVEPPQGGLPEGMPLP